MYVDVHVHLRDCNEQHKETIKHGLEVARDAGVIAVCDMPNSDPAVLDEAQALVRMMIARDANVPEVFYGVYMGATKDPEQVRRAVASCRRHEQIVGIKLYAGHSVRNLGVIGKELQLNSVYRPLAEEGFDKVLVVHAEKEECMKPALWTPGNPISHCLARPEEAEVASVEDQIENARLAGYKGKMHIAHISSPRAVDRVYEAKQSGLDISCGVCPHHLLFDFNQMNGENGLLYKMNPPLRSEESRKDLVQCLRDGKIDWLETDHAPHTLYEKTTHGYASGIPGLHRWPLFALWLGHLGFSDEKIIELTCTNAAKRYNLPIDLRRVPTKIIKAPYPVEVYNSLEQLLGVA